MANRHKSLCRRHHWAYFVPYIGGLISTLITGSVAQATEPGGGGMYIHVYFDGRDPDSNRTTVTTANTRASPVMRDGSFVYSYATFNWSGNEFTSQTRYGTGFIRYMTNYGIFYTEIQSGPLAGYGGYHEPGENNVYASAQLMHSTEFPIRLQVPAYGIDRPFNVVTSGDITWILDEASTDADPGEVEQYDLSNIDLPTDPVTPVAPSSNSEKVYGTFFNYEIGKIDAVGSYGDIGFVATAAGGSGLNLELETAWYTAWGGKTIVDAAFLGFTALASFVMPFRELRKAGGD